MSQNDSSPMHSSHFFQKASIKQMTQMRMSKFTRFHIRNDLIFARLISFENMKCKIASSSSRPSYTVTASENLRDIPLSLGSCILNWLYVWRLSYRRLLIWDLLAGDNYSIYCSKGQPGSSTLDAAFSCVFTKLVLLSCSKSFYVGSRVKSSISIPSSSASMRRYSSGSMF